MRDILATTVAYATVLRASKHLVSPLAEGRCDEYDPATYHMVPDSRLGIDLDQMASQKMSWIGPPGEA
jgi:hypothetical protein